MRVVYGRLPYELKFVELDRYEAVQRDGYEIAVVPVRHKGDAAYGYAIVEEPRPGHLDPQLAEQLGVTPGPDFGRLQRGEIVAGVRPEQVMGPTREGRKVVISGDTAPCQTLAVAAHRADVLVHEATFLHEELERARQTQHSTATQAAELALEAEVRLLALTHVSSRYAGGELRDEARSIFPATEALRDFDTIDVPFPERGRATLVRWSERLARERSQAGAQGALAASDAPRHPAASSQPDARPQPAAPSASSPQGEPVASP
jgi:ribonuclease Z